MTTTMIALDRKTATVADVMTTPANVVGPKAPLPEVMHRMTTGAREVVVALGRRPLGVITARHLLAVVNPPPGSWPLRQAGDLIAPRTVRLLPDLDISAAAAVMTRDRVEALPVVDYRGDLLGIVTQYDLVEWLAHNQGPR